MKLLHHSTRNFFVATLAILTIAGVALYLVLRGLVEEETYEQLDLQANMIAEELKKGNAVHYPLVEVVKVQPPYGASRIKGDTLIRDFGQRSHVKEDYQFLTVLKQVGQDKYRITVMTTFIGWDQYYKTIFKLLFLSAVLFGVAGIGLNYFYNRRVWRPFFYNLRALRHYSVSADLPVSFLTSDITEFAEMQRTLEDLIERSRREYTALREFTENASHEIQTPLGIIQSKLDRMSQMNVGEEMARYIVQAKEGVDRLRRMNKSLLLLAKLDNNAYTDTENIAMQQLVAEHLEQMEDLFMGKKLTVAADIQPFTVRANRYLADVLVSNLLVNTLHYTPDGGSVRVVTRPHSLVVSNDGPPLSFAAEQLFDRFKKGEQHSLSTGLGLSIVKQICLLNKWTVRYTYVGGKHVFTIDAGLESI